MINNYYRKSLVARFDTLRFLSLVAGHQSLVASRYPKAVVYIPGLCVSIMLTGDQQLGYYVYDEY